MPVFRALSLLLLVGAVIVALGLTVMLGEADLDAT